jgi:hypothetical protein
MEDKIVTLESFYDPMLAQIIRTRLEANDIRCFVADDNTLSANPFYNQAIGGIKVKIFERDLEKCREILAQDAVIEEGDEPLMTCPYCQSTDVYHGPVQEVKNWLSTALSVILASYPAFLEQKWICKNCGKNFD